MLHSYEGGADGFSSNRIHREEKQLIDNNEISYLKHFYAINNKELKLNIEAGTLLKLHKLLKEWSIKEKNKKHSAFIDIYQITSLSPDEDLKTSRLAEQIWMTEGDLIGYLRNDMTIKPDDVIPKDFWDI